MSLTIMLAHRIETWPRSLSKWSRIRYLPAEERFYGGAEKVDQEHMLERVSNATGPTH
jgi:hypothetical protein